MSACLEPFIKELLIDSAGQFPIRRVVQKDGKLVFIPTDHYTLILTLTSLQEANHVSNKDVVWNTMKENGWKKYKELTDDKAEEFNEIIEDTEISVEKAVEAFEKKLDKIKFAALGKTTI